MVLSWRIVEGAFELFNEARAVSCTWGGHHTTCWYLSALGVLRVVEGAILLLIVSWFTIVACRRWDAAKTLNRFWLAMGIAHCGHALCNAVKIAAGFAAGFEN